MEIANKKEFLKPVLCVLLSYAKMELYNESIRENCFYIDDFPELFYDYFPGELTKKTSQNF